MCINLLSIIISCYLTILIQQWKIYTEDFKIAQVLEVYLSSTTSVPNYLAALFGIMLLLELIPII